MLLAPASLVAMRSNPGPGGTLGVEIDGFGVSLGLRRTAEGIHVVVHGGSWAGQQSAFYFVPERDFAMTLLTNSDGGAQLRAELYFYDWVLQRFAGLHNPPAVPTRLPPERLAQYEGAYVARAVDKSVQWQETVLSLRASDGMLQGEMEQAGSVGDIGLQFYRDELNVLYLSRPHLIVPILWSDSPLHKQSSIKGSVFERALHEFVSRVGNSPWEPVRQAGRK
jgi:hypothetical protein